MIDSGLQRELAYDAKRRMSSLDTVWVSQSGAIQRRGPLAADCDERCLEPTCASSAGRCVPAWIRSCWASAVWEGAAIV